jgi:DNA-binding NarL/FixJ family response regulator
MNIGLAGPRLLIRKSLCALLSRIEGFHVVLDVDNPLDNLELIQKTRPDILLIDVVDSARNFEALSQLQTLSPEAKVLLLSDDVDEDFQLRAIRAGARGFVSNASDPALLERTLKRVARGEIWVGHQTASMIIGKLVRYPDSAGRNHSELSRREKQIVALLADGYRNKEIANLLGVSENTVRAHLVALYKKIRVTSRLGAALYYFEHARQAVAGVPLPSYAQSSGILKDAASRGHAAVARRPV